MNLLIKNGTVVTDQVVFDADILIEGERIAEIAPGLASRDAEVVDASGKYVLPGGVDVHAHMDLEMFNTVTSDDHYSGHKAAAFGGTTTVIDFVSHDKGSLRENIRRWHQKAGHNAAVDYGFHMNITRFDDQIAAELPSLLDEGISSLKVFTAYNDRFRLADQDIFQLMRLAEPLGLLTMVHAENGDIIDFLIKESVAAGHTEPIWHAYTRPAWTAIDAAVRTFTLAALTGAKIYLAHMNTAGEVFQMAYAREQGLPVMGETCMHYLFFTQDDLLRPDGAKYICSPPLRSPADQEGLWQGLQNGVIPVLSTDHCPFFYDGRRPIMYEGRQVAIPGKELGNDDFTKIPNGLPGLGDRMPVMWTMAVGAGRLTLPQFVATHCTNPARIFGMYPQKGCLQAGSDADIVIWDPTRQVTYGQAISRHRTDYNLYEGFPLTGMPEMVFLRGRRIIDDDKWLGTAGGGQFIHRVPGELI